MNDETIKQLNRFSHQLHIRSRELSQPENAPDIAMLMSAPAVTMDAVKSLGEDIDPLRGPKGLGADGS